MGALDNFLISEGLIKPDATLLGTGAKSIGSIPMGKPDYTLQSPELANFLGLKKIPLSPELKFEKRFGVTSSDFETPIAKLIGPDSWNVSQEYYDALNKQGANVEHLKALGNYQNFTTNWKQNQGIEKINFLTQIAQNNPNEIYSFGLQEGPLYRGAIVDPKTIPSAGKTLQLAGNRFRSFSPDFSTAWDFTQGIAPVYNENKQYDKIPAPKGNPTLFQVEQDLSGKYNYLMTPGEGEPEVLARPDAKYKVLDKRTFKNFGSNDVDVLRDLDVIKLQQIYGLDPFSSAAKGGASLLKENIPGAVFGASLSSLNPDVVKAIENNRYAKAASTVAKDVAGGALAEAGIKAAAPIAGKFAPGLVKAAAPITRLAGPAATGAALFSQGQTGSLTDVLARKAAANPVSWMPSVKANPQTDIGARAGRAVGNEARYMWQQLLRGKIPYTR